MADEKKKPWQFSLGRAMGATTAMCATLAISGALVSGALIIADHENRIGIIALVVSIGLGTAVGIIVGGKKGAIVLGLIGIFVWIIGCFMFGIIRTIWYMLGIIRFIMWY